MSDPSHTECRICGQRNPETLETHHIVPRRHGGSDHAENLVDLCGSCHNAVEAIYDGRFYERLRDAQQRGTAGVEEDLGHERHPVDSTDRDFPEHPLHVTRGEVLVQEALNNEWADKETIARYLEMVPAIELREQYGDEYPEEVLEEHRSPDVDAIQGTIPALDCGYCNRVFLKWERDECAKHLRLSHRVEDPYAEETTVITTGLLTDGETERKEVPRSHVASGYATGSAAKTTINKTDSNDAGDGGSDE